MTDEKPALSLRTRSREEVADYLLEIGTTLASYGCPSYRTEDVIRAIAKEEGFVAEPFALPTSLFLRVSPERRSAGNDLVPDAQRMARIVDWHVDLDRLTRVDEIFNDVIARKTTIERARTRIRDVVEKPNEWSKRIVWTATLVSSAAAAVFFRGSANDVLVAAIVGAVIGGARVMFAKRHAQRLLNDFLGGVFAATCAWLALRVFPDISPEVVVLAGSVSLFPGMTFTTGLAEVAQKNLVSGSARLVESTVTLLLILFGVALVTGLQTMVGIEIPPTLPRTGLGLGWQTAALVSSSIAFAMLFQVPKKFLWGALASGATGYIVTALTVRSIPTHVAAFCAALAVCILANALARATSRPAQLFQLPGMMLLVPGSFGFLSFGDFLRGQVLEGATKGFMMALVGTALVIGVLVANVILPARKLL